MYKKLTILVLVLFCFSTVFAETGLKEIWNEPYGSLGGKLKINGLFRNEEDNPVTARLTAEIYYNNNLLEVLISDELVVQPGSELNLTVYYPPAFHGVYSLKVYAIYDKQVSETKESIFTVSNTSAVAMGSFESIFILLGICIFAVFLHRKLNKNRQQPPR